MGYLGVLIAMLTIGLLFGGGLGRDVSLADLAKAGTWIFVVVAYGQVILVCLIAPLFMAGAIRSEQAGQTYDILMTTPLSNLQIVLGSLAGRLFFIIALLASGLPLFSVLLIFGGVPVSSVFVAFAVAALTALVVGAVAVAMSVFRVGGRKAVFAFVIGVAAYLIVAYAFDWVILRQLSLGANTTTWLTPLHPLLVLEASISPARYQPLSPEQLAGYPVLIQWYLGNPFAVFTVFSLGFSLLLILLSSVVLRRIGQGESRVINAVLTWLRLAGPPGQRRERTGREVWQNPIAWREANTRGNAAAGILARWSFVLLGLAAAGALLLAYHTGSLPQLQGPTGSMLAPYEVFQSALLSLLVLEVAVLMLIAIYMSAGCVSREREDGTLDLILTTPVTPKQYIWGKLRGLVSFLSLLIALPVLTVGVVSLYAAVGWLLGWPSATFSYTGINASGNSISRQPMLMQPEAALLLLLMLVPFVAVCVASGMSWSLKARGVLGAIVPTVAILGAAILVLGLCGWNAAGNVPLLGPAINAFSPVTNLFMIVSPWNHVAGYASNPTVGRLSLMVGAVVAAVGYSLVVWGMVFGMIKSFDHTVRRLSGTG